MSIHGLKLSHIKTSFCFHCPSWSSEGFFIAAFSFLLFFSRSKRAIEIQSHFTSMEQIQQFINLKHFSRIISNLLITINPFQRTVRTKGSFTNRQNFQTQPFFFHLQPRRGDSSDRIKKILCITHHCCQDACNCFIGVCCLNPLRIFKFEEELTNKFILIVGVCTSLNFGTC